MTQALIYVRISQDRDGEALGVARQEADARALAERRGWEVVDTVVENDTSAAKSGRRPGFDRLLRAVEGGEVDVVIAWALDRLTRNRRDTVALIECLQKRSALLALVRGSDLDMSTPAGRLTADVLAAVARNEIEQKSDRQRRATEQAAAAGRWTGGRRPFGYEPDGITPREPEAQAVRDAYATVLAGGSRGGIARRWNTAGLLTPQARPGCAQEGRWTGGIVHRALLKPRYAGLRAHQGAVVGPAQWPGLVDVETWRAAVAVLRDPERVHVHGAQALLTGIAMCGRCGGPVHASGAARGAQPVYRCRERGDLVRMREPVDDYVSAVAVARLARPDAADLLHARADTTGLRRESTDLRARLAELADLFAAGDVTADQLRRGTAGMKAKLATVEQRLAAALSTSPLRDVVGAGDVQAVWDQLDIERRRAVIAALMTVTLHSPGRGSRTFHPETVAVDWRAS